jgi:predicted metalloendopeptidase
MLLESESLKDEPKPFRMAKAVYKSCMDTEAIEGLGIQPMKDILKKFGGWPGRGLFTQPNRYVHSEFMPYSMML